MKTLNVLFVVFLLNSAFAYSLPQTRCVAVGNGYHPVRIGDGQPLGGKPMSSYDCSRAVNNAGPDVVCARFNDGYYSTNYVTGASFGGFGINIEHCLEATRSANQGLVCTPYSQGFIPSRIYGGNALSTFGTNLNTCARLTATAANDKVCLQQKDGFHISKISTGHIFGQGFSLERCISYLKLPSRCDSVIGDWRWMPGSHSVHLYPKGMAKGLTVTGTQFNGYWTCVNEQEGRIQVSWGTGYSDYLSLSNDNQTLNGSNNHGDAVTAFRQ